jgi:putative oxidoreductase
MDLWTILAWLGRIGFSAFFISSGVSHFKNAKGIAGYAQSKGVPAAAIGVPVSGAMLLVGGVLILFSWHAIIGAALLVLFLLPAAFMIHNYWVESDPMMRANQTAHFWKNLALAAAAVLIAVGHHRGAL